MSAKLAGSRAGLEAMDISATDNILCIGGDSISAMRIVAAALKQTFALSVEDVFQQQINEEAKYSFDGSFEGSVRCE